MNKTKNVKRQSKQEEKCPDEKPREDKTQQNVNCSTASEHDFEMIVTPLFPEGVNEKRHANAAVENERVFKPISGLYPPGSEWFEMAELISKEIVLKDLNVHWEDINGLDSCKSSLKEAIVYPIKYPALFKGKFSPWKGILLYGVPGTGKTMLAKAAATECKCTFFNITASSLVSKWRGDSEKYIRVLLDLAVYYAPTIIFIDEIDWIATSSHDVSSSEPARRFRAELLSRLDGLTSLENSNVILLAATNVPWNIDAALLRRLEKKIHVEMPNSSTRHAILQTYINPILHNKASVTNLVGKTDGFSCADLKLLCKAAWLLQLETTWKELETNRISVKDVEKDWINDTDLLFTALEHIKPAPDTVLENLKQWDSRIKNTN